MEAILGSDTRLRLEGGVDFFSSSGLRASASYFKDGIGASGFETDGWRFSIGFTPSGR